MGKTDEEGGLEEKAEALKGDLFLHIYFVFYIYLFFIY
jgi:hypothetical protein